MRCAKSIANSRCLMVDSEWRAVRPASSLNNTSLTCELLIHFALTVTNERNLRCLPNRFRRHRDE